MFLFSPAMETDTESGFYESVEDYRTDDTGNDKLPSQEIVRISTPPPLPMRQKLSAEQKRLSTLFLNVNRLLDQIKELYQTDESSNTRYALLKEELDISVKSEVAVATLIDLSNDDDTTHPDSLPIPYHNAPSAPTSSEYVEPTKSVSTEVRIYSLKKEPIYAVINKNRGNKLGPYTHTGSPSLATLTRALS